MLLIFICFINSVCFPQSKDLSISGATSIHTEYRKRTFWNGNRNSFAVSYGIGVELQKKFTSNWGFDLGINYFNRRYVMNITYNHCYFIDDPLDCFLIYRYVSEFGYKTLEIPFGITRYLKVNEKWETYVDLNAVMAVDFQSYYKETVREIVNKDNELHLFSGSITGSFGVGRRFAERYVLNFEPLLRIINIQRDDPIIDGTENKLTFLNDFGLHVSLKYEL